MQIAFAVGAEIEASADHGGAARAGEWQRLAYLEVQNETNGEEWPGEQHAQKQPKPSIHSAASRIAVYVTESRQPNGDNYGHESDDSRQRERCDCGVASQIWRESFAIDAREIYQRTDGDGREPQHHAGPHHPLRYEFYFRFFFAKFFGAHAHPELRAAG